MENGSKTIVWPKYDLKYKLKRMQAQAGYLAKEMIYYTLKENHSIRFCKLNEAGSYENILLWS